MSRTNSTGVSQLRQLIYYHIDNELLDTANFLAGRLLAIDQKNADSLHLLALTYLRLRRFRAAHDFAHRFGHNGKHLGCAYVFAQACLELGEHADGCKALELAKNLWHGKSNWSKHSETSRRHVPDAAAACTLLAKLWCAYGDLHKAGDYYVEAHKANPLIWDAFDGLCKIGADLNVQSMFNLPPDMSSNSPDTNLARPLVYTGEDTSISQPLAPQNNFNQQVFTPSADPFRSDAPAKDWKSSLFALPNVKSRTAAAKALVKDEWETPSATGVVLDGDVAMGDASEESEDDAADSRGIPAAPSRRPPRPLPSLLDQADKVPPPQLRGLTQTGSESSQIGRAVGGQKRTISGQAPQVSTAASIDSGAPPRRSHRLGQSSSRLLRSAAESTSSLASRLERSSRASKAATGTKGRTQVGRVVSGNSNRKPLLPEQTDREKEKRAPSRLGDKSSAITSAIAKVPAAAPTQHSDAQRQAEKQAMTSLLNEFRTLALGYYAAARFDHPLAIATLKALPAAQLQTPWVLAQLGKAYYEALDYKNAEECFARILKMQPSYTEDMEVYSTILWHLKKEPVLACLCHALKDQDFHSPQTWCAIGNAFSLSRDHDQAIAAFNRATQIDDRFAYAWTLMGHEFIANEEFDAALGSFRKAVAVDRRGYGGWYGLGKSYERMGKLEDAERHYRIAASINPSNSTLLVCIGVVLERQRNRSAALANYAMAIELGPESSASSALARFKKARVLMQMKDYEAAERDLEILREQAPDEANVWFLLGKCYKGLGKKSDALRAFTTALNLDVKAADFIKEAMESLDLNDESSDDE